MGVNDIEDLNIQTFLKLNLTNIIPQNEIDIENSRLLDIDNRAAENQIKLNFISILIKIIKTHRLIK